MEQKQFTLVKMQQAKQKRYIWRESTVNKPIMEKTNQKKLMMDSHQTICIFKTPCDDLNTNYPENIRV